MFLNAQEIMFMSRRRMCTQADETTKQIIESLCDKIVQVCPEFDGCFEPMCSYRGGRCTEFICCGLNKKFKNLDLFNAAAFHIANSCKNAILHFML